MPAGDESDDETGDRSVLTDDGLADFSLEGQEGLLGVLLGAAEGSARPAFARGGGVRDGPPARAADTGIPVGAGYEAGDPWGG